MEDIMNYDSKFTVCKCENKELEWKDLIIPEKPLAVDYQVANHWGLLRNKSTGKILSFDVSRDHPTVCLTFQKGKRGTLLNVDIFVLLAYQDSPANGFPTE